MPSTDSTPPHPPPRCPQLPFDPFSKQPKMSYKDGYQKQYFALDSFEGGARQLKDYAATLRMPCELRGDASVA
jgi:hypothetical protein